MIPKSQHRPRRALGKAANVAGMIQQLVRVALEQPPDEGNLYHRLVRGVEKELLEQTLPLCDNVLIKAAARLGINRNTLHKKLAELNSELVAKR
jgi:DNA-binding protein Fis